jgi:hypothetical protein
MSLLCDIEEPAEEAVPDLYFGNKSIVDSMLSSFGTVPVSRQFNFITKFFFVNKNKKLER